VALAVALRERLHDRASDQHPDDRDEHPAKTEARRVDRRLPADLAVLDHERADRSRAHAVADAAAGIGRTAAATTATRDRCGGNDREPVLPDRDAVDALHGD